MYPPDTDLCPEPRTRRITGSNGQGANPVGTPSGANGNVIVLTTAEDSDGNSQTTAQQVPYSTFCGS